MKFNNFHYDFSELAQRHLLGIFKKYPTSNRIYKHFRIVEYCDCMLCFNDWLKQKIYTFFTHFEAEVARPPEKFTNIRPP